jgi:hypothetical protein
MSRAHTDTPPEPDWTEEAAAWTEASASAWDLAAIRQAGGYAAILDSEQAHVDLQEILGPLLRARIKLVRCELAERGWLLQQPHGTLRLDVASRQLVFRLKESSEGNGAHNASIHYSVFDLTESESHEHHLPVLQIRDDMACRVPEFVTRLGTDINRALCDRAAQSELEWLRTHAQLRTKHDWQKQFLVLSDNYRVYMPGRHPGPPLQYPDPSLEGVPLIFMDDERAADVARRLEAQWPEYGPYSRFQAAAYTLWRASAQESLRNTLTTRYAEPRVDPPSGSVSLRAAAQHAPGGTEYVTGQMPSSKTVRLTVPPEPSVSIEDLTHVLADTYLDALASDSDKAFDAAIVHTSGRIADALEAREVAFDREAFFRKSGMPDPRMTNPNQGSSLDP